MRSRAAGPPPVNRKGRLPGPSEAGFRGKGMFLLISPAAPDRTCRMSRQERDLTEPGGRARTARECPSEGQEQGKGTQSSLELLASRRSGSQTTAEPRAEAVQARALAGRGGAGRGHYISRQRTSARTVVFSAPNPTAGHCQPMPPPETPTTHRQVWFSLWWGHCSFLLGPG